MPPEIEPVDRGDAFDASGVPAAPATPAASAAPVVDVAGATADDDRQSGRDDKGRFIPKARFDEAVSKERDARESAERKITELQQQLQSVARTADTAALEEQITELRKAANRATMDGDEEKNIAALASIDRLNRQIIIAESQNMSNQAQEGAREGIRVEIAIERLEGIYPALKEGAEEFDQGLVDLVLAQQQQLIMRDRMAPSQALTKAANDIMVRFQAAQTIDDKPAGGLGNAAGVGGVARTTAAKTKAVDAALRTPADTRDVGLDTDKAGMTGGTPLPMTVEELAAIPLATLKRMRGDMA